MTAASSFASVLASKLRPLSDSTRLELEAELIDLMVATAPRVRVLRVVQVGNA